MNPDIQRARFYMNQRRYKEAQAELAKVLASEPDNSMAHTMLGFCLHRSGDKVAGRKEAVIGVGLDPASSYAHRMVGHICFESGDQKTAEQALREALRLQPNDANAYGMLALSLAVRARWKESLEVAEAGLAIDPNDVNCVNARSQAISVIGGKEDTQRAVQQALQENSQDPLAQTYAGWAMLRQNRSKEAVEHFREALRLDPQREDARRGLLEALRARVPLYRMLIAWQRWSLRFPSNGRRGLIFGLYFVFRFCMYEADANPRLQPFLYPLMGAYALFALFTWVGAPLMNIALLGHPLGRMALSRAGRIETTALAVLVGTTLLALALGLGFHREMVLVGSAIGLICTILAAMLTNGWDSHGRTAVICTVCYVFVALVLVFIVLGMTGGNQPAMHDGNSPVV